MIDKIYIQSATSIRSEFLKLNSKLDEYQNELKRLVLFLEKISKELQDFSKNELKKIKTKNDATKVVENIVKKMTEIEEEEQKLIRLIKPINDKIEKLRLEETHLYEQIKEKYPTMNDTDMRREIQSHLEK